MSERERECVRERERHPRGSGGCWSSLFSGPAPATSTKGYEANPATGHEANRESVCVRVCVREKERERERERESVCVYECVCKRERQREKYARVVLEDGHLFFQVLHLKERERVWLVWSESECVR